LYKWIANYRLVLVSVKAQGRPLGIGSQGGDDDNTFVFKDETLKVTVFPGQTTIDLHIENHAERSVKIRWDDAVFVDFDHVSNPIGRESGDLPDPSAMPSFRVIAPGTSIQERVFPKSRLYEVSSTVHSTDSACVQRCNEEMYQCMAAYNCSGWRSRQPYTGQNWALFAVADAIDSSLCQRRCGDQAGACVAASCARVSQRSEGYRLLPMVPDLRRQCSQSEDDFVKIAETAEPQTYAILLPIELGGSTREYLLSFEGELFQYQLGVDCR
jgi:hypothetical protein